VDIDSEYVNDVAVLIVHPALVLKIHVHLLQQLYFSQLVHKDLSLLANQQVSPHY